MAANDWPLPKRNEYISGGADLHTAAVDVVEEDAYITSLRVNNTTAGALTFTLIDKSAELNNFHKDVSIAANGAFIELATIEPLYCEGGFDIQASATGLEVVCIYYTRPAQ